MSDSEDIDGRLDHRVHELALWKKANADLDALQDTITSHFKEPCQKEEDLPGGSFARVFKYVLDSGKRVVARIVLPVREHVKTESEVATMCFIRTHTTITVPEVYLYCSTPFNPVNAEWILMEFLPGDNLRGSIASFGHEQCLRFANDLAEINYSLYRLTSDYCGSLLQDLSTDKEHRSLAYIPSDSLLKRPSFNTVASQIDGKQILIGPVNEVSLISNFDTVESKLCGPFRTESEFLACCTWKGDTRDKDTIPLYEKMLEIFDAIRSVSRAQSSVKPPPGFNPEDETQVFHFSHGDLTYENMRVDLETGAIIGVIDWEASGFYPAWLASRNNTYFNDDVYRSLMDEGQEVLMENDDDEETIIERERYLSRLFEFSPELHYHDRMDAEVRSLFYHLSHPFEESSLLWLIDYRKAVWDESKRGPFPIENMAKWTEDLNMGLLWSDEEEASTSEVRSQGN